MSTSPLLGARVAEYDTNLETAANEYYQDLIHNEDALDEDDDEDDDVTLLRDERLKHQSIHWLRRPSVVMVGLMVFLFAFAQGISAATHKILQVKLTCNYLAENSKDGLCDQAEVQLVISNLQMAYSILGNIVMLVASGKVAALSDQYGRKIFLIGVISTIGLGRLTRFLTIIKWDTLHFGTMVFTEVLSYLGGGPLSLVALLNCYVADVVDPQHRIYYLSVSISAAMLIGSFLAPLAGNLLISASDKITNPGGLKLIEAGTVDVASAIRPAEILPIKFEIGIFFFLWLFTMFVLPESRSQVQRRKSRSSTATAPSAAIILENHQHSWYSSLLKSANFLQPLKLLIIPNEYLGNVPPSKRSRLKIGVFLLILVDTLLTAFKIVLEEILMLYGIYKFKWTQSEIGILTAVSCIAMAFALIVFLPILNNFILQKLLKFRVLKRSFDMVDYGIVMFGISADVLGFILLYLATNTTQIMLTTLVSSFGPISAPTLNSTIVKYYPQSKVGELYGALALTKNLLGLVAPVMFLSLYKFFIAQWNKPELIFMVYGVLFLFLFGGIVGAKVIFGLDENTVSPLTRSNSTVTFRTSSISEGNDSTPSSSSSKKTDGVRINVENVQ